MRALTHQIAGAGLAGVSAAAGDARVTTAAVLVGAACVGSLLPDADLAGARVHRRTRIERQVPVLWLAGMALRLPVRVLSLLPHRGPTHSVLACVLVTVLCAVAVRLVDPALAPAAAAGVAIGYGGHLAADACTPSGVPLWAPLLGSRRWLLPARARITTGSAREYLALALLSMLLFVAALPLSDRRHPLCSHPAPPTRRAATRATAPPRARQPTGRRPLVARASRTPRRCRYAREQTLRHRAVLAGRADEWMRLGL